MDYGLHSLEVDVGLPIGVLDKDAYETSSYEDGAAVDVQILERLVPILG